MASASFLASRALSSESGGVALLFLLLLIQVATELVIAGTDLFWPPFGYWFAAWVAPGVDPTLVVPGTTDLVDRSGYETMRALRSPFVEVHELGFYAVAVVIVLHLIAVVATELPEGGSITSAMFTGRKILLASSARCTVKDP